ncbi:MAG: SDR family NAD(P)-dependent oxidoreductase [Bdellovibrionales bacterium]|nr:SDR family NAD(P)-dependent oxidoreductase [Bdellovibrionales bacterium]
MQTEGKVAVVTGGVSGFGRAMVEQLCKQGAQVVVFDRDPDGAQKLSQNETKDVLFLQCDITVPGEVEKAVETTFQQFGCIDILINNAGILFSAPLISFSGGKFERHSIEDWNKVINTNLTSVFLVTSFVAQKMVQKRTKGVIINISSISANGNPGQSAYSAAKAGVNALTATWARELSMLGIRVAAVAPGFFDTPSTHEAVPETTLKEIKKRIPLRRLGKMEELVYGVMHIIANDFYNGKVLELDGGHVLS